MVAPNGYLPFVTFGFTGLVLFKSNSLDASRPILRLLMSWVGGVKEGKSEGQVLKDLRAMDHYLVPCVTAKNIGHSCLHTTMQARTISYLSLEH